MLYADECRKVIQEQQMLLEKSLGSNAEKSKRNTEASKEDTEIFEKLKYEVETERSRLEKLKQQLDSERKQFTEAAIKLGRERAVFEAIISFYCIL